MKSMALLFMHQAIIVMLGHPVSTFGTALWKQSCTDYFVFYF